MSYVEQVLGAGENIVMKARITLFAFVIDFFAILVCISLDLFQYVWWLFVIDVIHKLLVIITTELVLTDKRVIAKFGIIRRNTIELRLEKVESIGINQGIIGRIFNYGTILVNGAGTTAPIPYISKPINFKRKVDEYVENISSK